MVRSSCSHRPKETAARSGARRLGPVVGLPLLLGCAVSAPTELELTQELEPYAFVSMALDPNAATALTAFVAPGAAPAGSLIPGEPALPDHPGCAFRRESQQVGALDETGPGAAAAPLAEFMLADSVELRLGLESSELAPYAFPRLGRQLGGAVYASRRFRLPASQSGESFTLFARGISGSQAGASGERARREFHFELPLRVHGITTFGVPIDEVTEVTLGREWHFSWVAPSPPKTLTAAHQEWVIVELETPQRLLSCAYAATSAAGEIPASWLSGFSLEGAEEIGLTLRWAGQQDAVGLSGFRGADVRFEATLVRSSVRIVAQEPSSPAPDR